MNDVPILRSSKSILTLPDGKELDIAAVIATPQLEANYDMFIAELTKLTRKYGVAIQSVGGVNSLRRLAMCACLDERVGGDFERTEGRIVSN